MTQNNIFEVNSYYFEDVGCAYSVVAFELQLAGLPDVAELAQCCAHLRGPAALFAESCYSVFLVIMSPPQQKLASKFPKFIIPVESKLIAFLKHILFAMFC